MPIYLASFWLTDFMVAAGEAGRAIGVGLLGLYLAVLSAAAGGGRTLGHRVTGLRVVDAHGEGISLARSLVRAAILVLPLYAALFSVRRYFANEDAAEIATIAWSVIVVGIGGSLFYLFMLGRGQQSLHDVLTGTYVARTKRDFVATEVGAWHWAAVFGIFVLSVVAPMVPLAWFEGWEPGRTVVFGMKLHRALQANHTLEMRGFEAQMGNSSSSLEIGVWLYKPADDLTPVCRRVADQVFALAPDLLGYRNFAVRVGYGWDFGIAAAQRGLVCYGTLEQWRSGTQATQSFSLDLAGALSHYKER